MIVELIIDGKCVAQYSGANSGLGFLSSALSAMAAAESERATLSTEMYKKAIEHLDKRFFKKAPTDHQQEDPK